MVGPLLQQNVYGYWILKYNKILTKTRNFKALLILSLDPALYPSFHQVIYHIQAGPPASYYSMTVASLLTNITKFGGGKDEATTTQRAENVLLIF